MKRLLALILVMVLALATMTACTPEEAVGTAKDTVLELYETAKKTVCSWLGIEVEDDCDKDCNKDDANQNATPDNGNNNGNSGTNTDNVKVMTYADYVAAKVDDEIVIDAYVQACQSWWNNKITVYLADHDGAYFVYELACSEEDAAKLTPGTKIRVIGYKAIWSGEIEIVDATFTFIEGADTYIAPAKDLTNVLGTADMINYQNQLALFKGLTIKSIEYKNGTPGNDIYVTLTKDNVDYDFCVESYLTGPDTDVYKAFADLVEGDVVNVEGFVYWYNGINTHITSVTKYVKTQSVMTYAEYMAAAIDEEVIIEAYVQASQSWWNNRITLYLADRDGAYFAYQLACSREDAAKLTPGTKIKVTGYKTVWAGQIEIIDATFTFIEGADTYIAPAKDITAALGTSELITYQNRLALFKGLTVKSIEYKNGVPGNDIYVIFTYGGSNYNFCVESSLTGSDTETYQAFADLVEGDVVDVEGFVYWYNGINTHITAVKKATSVSVMTYAEYMAAELDDEVVIEAYVQAHQSWWNNKITVYLADFDGAYFVYELACSEADAARLIPGTKIQVTGYKAAWEGEIEIVDATFTFVEGRDTYIAPAKDITAALGTDALINYQNQLALFKGLTIKSIEYKNGTPGNDIYVTLTYGGVDYDFCVESYLTGPDTDVYKAFANLAEGDVVDVEGFVYWYNGINTHITAVQKAKSAGVMTYAEYMAAAFDDEVVIEAYVQAHQSWWNNKITVYLADFDGAYFVYDLACSEADAAKLTPGTKIKVTGYKTSWAGEIEIADATFTFVEGAETYIAPAKDVTAYLGTDELINYQNQLALFKGLTIKSIEYKNGTPGDDIYVTFTKNGVDYDFCVERYLTGPETEVYQAFATLVAGDVVDVEGFVYWYNGINTHITKITKVG